MSRFVDWPVISTDRATQSRDPVKPLHVPADLMNDAAVGRTNPSGRVPAMINSGR
jgi:hypothetical protein